MRVRRVLAWVAAACCAACNADIQDVQVSPFLPLTLTSEYVETYKRMAIDDLFLWPKPTKIDVDVGPPIEVLCDFPYYNLGVVGRMRGRLTAVSTKYTDENKNIVESKKGHFDPYHGSYRSFRFVTNYEDYQMFCAF